MFGLDGEIKYEDKTKVIVFLNGSNHWADWITNFIFSARGGIHRGWLKFTQEAAWLHEAAKKAKEAGKEFYLIGYSMGGACAEIFSWDNPSLVTRCFTFGAPKGMNRKNQGYLYNKVSVWQYRNRWDIVPILPPYWGRDKKRLSILLPGKGHKYNKYQAAIDELIDDLKE